MKTLRKSQNLKIIIAIEIVLLVCVCLGGVGIYFYVNNDLGNANEGNPPPDPTQVEAIPSPLSTDILATETPVEMATSGPSGTKLEHLPDGTLKYTDFDGGFEISYPAGWVAARPENTEEFNALKAAEGAKNEMLRDQMDLDLAKYKAEYDRLYSYPLRPDIKQNIIFGFSQIEWERDNKAAVNNGSMGKFIRDLEASGAIPGFRATASSIIENGNQVSVMVIKGRFSLDDGQGGTIPFVVTFLFFKPDPSSIGRLSFTILQDYSDQITPDIDFIAESIKLLK